MNHPPVNHPSVNHPSLSPVPVPEWGLLRVWLGARPPVPLLCPSSSHPGRPSIPHLWGSSWHRCAATHPVAGTVAAAPPTGQRTRWLQLDTPSQNVFNWERDVYAVIGTPFTKVTLHYTAHCHQIYMHEQHWRKALMCCNNTCLL